MKTLKTAVKTGLILLTTLAIHAQNLFVSDEGANTIIEFTPSGTGSVFASGLSNPMGLAFDGSGNLFEADSGSGNIYEFTPGGARTTFASGLDDPRGLAVNSAGDLFVSEYPSSIIEITPSGGESTFASGTYPSLLSGPEGLAFNSAGDLFVANGGASYPYIIEITPGGGQSIYALLGTLDVGLAFNTAGDLFAASWGNGAIWEIPPGGSPTGSFQSVFATGYYPEGLALNSGGDLFEADGGSGNIYQFTPDGARSTFASGLDAPVGLAFQPVSVPEPSTMPLSVAGAAVLLVFCKKAHLQPNCGFGCYPSRNAKFVTTGWRSCACDGA